MSMIERFAMKLQIILGELPLWFDSAPVTQADICSAMMYKIDIIAHCRC